MKRDSRALLDGYIWGNIWGRSVYVGEREWAWAHEGGRRELNKHLSVNPILARHYSKKFRVREKAKWDREAEKTKTRRSITRLTTASQKAQLTALSDGTSERPYAAPQNNQLWEDEGYTFICRFFPGPYLSLVGPMDILTPETALYDWVALAVLVTAACEELLTGWEQALCDCGGCAEPQLGSRSGRKWSGPSRSGVVYTLRSAHTLQIIYSFILKSHQQ